MDQAGYIAFLEDQRRNAGSPDPQCVKKSTKKIALKNRYWTTTPTQVDLEKEVLGHTFSTPYVYIHGYLDNSDPNLQQSFSHIFIRSNLSLTFEDGKDRHILFASSYDGKSIPPDLSFEAYHWIEPYGQSGHYEKIVHPPIAYSAAKQLYTFSDADLTIDLLVAKNSKYYGVLNFAQDVTSNYDFKYISGMDATTRDYLYVYPDRPLYQLGDSVSFK